MHSSDSPPPPLLPASVVQCPSCRQRECATFEYRSHLECDRSRIDIERSAASCWVNIRSSRACNCCPYRFLSTSSKRKKGGFPRRTRIPSISAPSHTGGPASRLGARGQSLSSNRSSIYSWIDPIVWSTYNYGRFDYVYWYS